MTDEQGEIIIYQTNNGKNNIDVKLEGETVWLTQAQLVELYQSSKSNVSEHIKHIFEEKELEENSVCLLYTSPSPRDGLLSRMPSSA